MIGLLAGLSLLAVIFIVALILCMDRWGATENEIPATFTGDKLVPSLRIACIRDISIHATSEEIYPWIVQLGVERGGMYSYEWFETNILRCELINVDRSLAVSPRPAGRRLDPAHPALPQCCARLVLGCDTSWGIHYGSRYDVGNQRTRGRNDTGALIWGWNS